MGCLLGGARGDLRPGPWLNVPAFRCHRVLGLGRIDAGLSVAIRLERLGVVRIVALANYQDIRLFEQPCCLPRIVVTERHPTLGLRWIVPLLSGKPIG